MEYLELLKLMLEDMANAPAIYRPTSFWNKAVNAISEELFSKGLEGFRSHPTALNFYVPTYQYPNYNANQGLAKGIMDAFRGSAWDNPKLKTRQTALLSGEQQAFSDFRVYAASLDNSHPFSDKVSESQIGKPVEQFTFDGRRFSRSILNYLLGINFLKKSCNTVGIHTVMEIGGGFGSLGEILLTDSRNKCFFMDVDIPPVCFAATYYLQLLLGVKNVADYSLLKSLKGAGEIRIEDLKGSYAAAVLCPWQLPALSGKIDLFVNYISFQEMEPDIVENYFFNVRRLNPQYILLRNLREGKQVQSKEGGVGVKKPILGKDYDKFIPEYRLLNVNTVPFGHLTEDGFHSELRLYTK